MLVLARRVDQSLVFPEVGITVVVCAIEGNKVKLGVTAPGVRVFRHELMDRIDPWTVQKQPEADDGGAK